MGFIISNTFDWDTNKGKRNFEDSNNNDGFEEEQEEKAFHPEEQIKTLFIKFLSVLIIAILLSSIISNYSAFIPPPTPDFVQQSRILSQDPMIQKWQESIVEVKAITGDDDGEWMGTGFNVHSEGYIITAYHIIKNAERVEVSFSKHDVYNPSKWVGFPEVDLAVIILESSNLPYVNLQLDDIPKRGDEVVIIGNPLGYNRIAMEGEIMDIWIPSTINHPVFEIEAPIHKGNSGSPVFDESGKVIAVVSAILSDNEDKPIRGLAMPVSYISNLME